MKILVMPKPIEGVSREEIATLPFAQLHLIDFDVIPLAPFFGLEQLSAARG